MHTFYLDQIKSFEGFTPTAEWDHAQHSNGFGTKALFPGEQIDRLEAQRRFTAEISRAREFVERQTSGLDEGTKAALTSLTFNAGTRWASSGLGEALRNGDLETAKEKFLTYSKAGGDELSGLVKRRQLESSWIGNPVPPGTLAEVNTTPALARTVLASVPAVPELPSNPALAPTSPIDLVTNSVDIHNRHQGSNSALSTFALSILMMDLDLLSPREDASSKRT